MKLRFLTTIAAERWVFRAGQVVEVPALTPDLAVWLEPGRDGQRRAEVVVEDEIETATLRVPVRDTMRRKVRRRPS